MREIKFRIWDKTIKKWLCEDFFALVMDGSKVVPLPGATISFNMTDGDFVVQQFTGLKDGNNVEIYEGDIINFTIPGIVHGPEAEHITNAEVWYSEEDLQFVFGRYKNKDYTWWYSMADRIDKASIEIVGNIFENPTLLK